MRRKPSFFEVYGVFANHRLKCLRYFRACTPKEKFTNGSTRSLVPKHS